VALLFLQISYDGHQLQPTTASGAGGDRSGHPNRHVRVSRESRESRESSGSQLLESVTGRPVRESTESIGATGGASTRGRPSRRAAAATLAGTGGANGGAGSFKGGRRIKDAKDAGRVPTPLPQARTVRRVAASGERQAETYVVDDLKSPANATTARSRHGSGSGYGGHGSGEGGEWAAGGGKQGGRASASPKPTAPPARRPSSRSRPPNLPTIPAGTSMDARF
jgi:hypothetical protein